MDLETLHRSLKLAKERKQFEKWRFFIPVPKQEEFLAATSTHQEVLLMAGNRLGKCISAATLVQHPDGASTPVGVLAARGEPFEVLTLTGEGLRSARVTQMVVKPPEPMVRVWLRSGDWFECALDHRVLVSGGWAYVREVLPFLPQTIRGYTRSVLTLGARRLLGTLRDFRERCFQDFRPDGGLLLSAPGSGHGQLPIRGGFRECSPQQFGGGATPAAPTDTGNGQSGSALPSNRGDRSQTEVRFVELRGRGVCRSAPRNFGLRRVFRRFSIAASYRLRRVVEGRRGRSPVSFVSPIDGNELVSYESISSQQVYDFTVPETHNYVAGGWVHHNTESAAYAVSRWMTGEYPPWWKGKVFNGPVRVWAAGTSGQMVRDTAQEKLCGPPGQSEAFGTGFIPKSAFVDHPKAGRSASDSFDSLQVRHKSGGISRLVFKTYEQERRHWQGAEVDILWLDEEPPMEIYTEGYTRLGGKGLVVMTFTPLFGMSDVVVRFLEEENPRRTFVQYGIKDATFKSEPERAALVAGYPPHEREARANGDPLLGSGKVFSTPAADLVVPQIPLERVPHHWAKLWGIDFGGGSESAHPFAAVLLAWDREDVVSRHSGSNLPNPQGPIGTMYVLHEIRMTNSLILQHCEAMKRVGAGVPVAWPHDGHEKERSSGESMAALYKKQGLKMLDSHATHASGGYSTYAGIMDMDAYMAARQWKVSENCMNWFQEYGQYHYKNGVLVKLRDDLMSASRIGHIMRRRAQAVPLGPSGRRAERHAPPVINPWTGREVAHIPQSRPS